MFAFALVLLFSLFVNSSESTALELSGSDFHSKIAGFDLVLVKFYATWCGHCKKLAPAYGSAAVKLLQNDPPITLVQVNCPDNEALCKEFDVSGYPTLKIFKKGKFIDNYEGPRTEDGIIEIMKARAMPTVRDVNSAADLEKFRQEDKSIFLATVKSKDSELAKVFSELADSLHMKYVFALTTNDKIAGPGEKIQRILPNKFKSKLEEDVVTYEGSNKLNNIQEWVRNVWGGVLPLKNFNNVDLFDKSPHTTVFAKVDYERDPKGTTYIRNRILKAINEVKKELPDMTYSFASGIEMSSEFESFGWKDFENVHAAIVDGNNKKYVMEKEFTWQNLKQFLLAYKNGKIEQFIKSESLESDEKSPVTRIVGKNFDELITNSKKDVLLEFYAPWCGHCKNLKPVYEKLAEAMSDEENIMIAAIDATANDFPTKTFEVQGFPTIFWIPAKGTPVQYHGERDLESFIKYISKSSTKPLKTFDSTGKSTKDEL